MCFKIKTPHINRYIYTLFYAHKTLSVHIHDLSFKAILYCKAFYLEVYMKYVVVPVMNEEESLISTINALKSSITDKIMLVANGCSDITLNIINSLLTENIEALFFRDPLGYDVPRAIGAYYAYQDGATSISFIDSDMHHINVSVVDELFYRLEFENDDMVLVETIQSSGNNKEKNILAAYIRELNVNLSLYTSIGYATPSIGPHGISRLLLDTIGMHPLAIPPLSLALGKKHNLRISAPINIPINIVSSNIKDELHARLIMDTIIGDCIYSWNNFNANTRSEKRDIYIGYHNSRRIDLLKLITSSS